MRICKSKSRSGEHVQQYTYLGCPLTRNRTAWCFRLCVPDADGRGRCGRIAPHALKSRIQECIERFNKRRANSQEPP